jgi:hypothetical protein
MERIGKDQKGLLIPLDRVTLQRPFLCHEHVQGASLTLSQTEGQLSLSTETSIPNKKIREILNIFNNKF